MLYKQAALVLKAVNKMTKYQDYATITDIEIYFHDKKFEKEIIDHLLYLEEEKYIVITHQPENDIVEHIVPTIKGRNYENIVRQDRKSLIFRGFLLPFGVALATTIVTLIVNGVLDL